MTKSPLISRWSRAGLGTLLLTLAALSVSAASPKRVLLIHSFGRDFAPYNTFSGVLRTELASQSSGAVDIFEVSLDSAVVGDTAQEGPLVSYLAALSAGRLFDLVIPVGGPAVQFAQRHRQLLFPRTPMLIAGTDERHIRQPTLTPNDAVVAGRIELSRVAQTILQVLPQTTNVVVIAGASPLEKFWLKEIRDAWQPWTNRVSLQTLNQLSFAGMLQRCAALPPRSAIFYALMITDAEGVPQWEEGALTRLHAAANAPLFGVFETQLGRGIVGGSLVDMEEMGRKTAKVATRILRAEAPAALRLPTQEMGVPQFDWRELQRWGISEARLPAGSVVRFRQPGIWERYWWLVCGGILVGVVEAALIVGLLMNRAKRRQSEARLTAAVDVASLGFYEIGPDPELLFVDNRTRSLLGLTPGQDARTQEFWAEHIHPDDRERVMELSRKLAQGELKWAAVEYRYQHPERGTLWFSHAARAEERDASGKVVRRLGVIQDITAQRRAELESQRLRGNLAHLTRVNTLGTLSGSLAHELNQPLGIILSNAQAAQELLIQEPPDTAEVQAILADIVKADRRAGEVIERLRALFKGGQASLQQLSLNAVVEEVLRLTRAELLGRGVTTICELAPDLPLVQGDRVQLQQLVLNLILNAADAMAANALGTRRLHLRTMLRLDRVRASVRDEGEGLPADVEQLFQPLYTTKPQGLGMGLAICRSIVGAHGGRLWAERHPERGAVFHFELPVAGAQGRGTRDEGQGGREGGLQ